MLDEAGSETSAQTVQRFTPVAQFFGRVLASFRKLSVPYVSRFSNTAR